METIRLEFQPKIKAKIVQVLSSFSLDELKIVQEDPAFEKTKKMLQTNFDNKNMRDYIFKRVYCCLQNSY
ncbi:hypothetical protein [Flavobacterium sp.]|uniref:hypothetical protein n=1 Tax=Flavobacterium sp. TaxID=239 RepID=UPI003C606D52